MSIGALKGYPLIVTAAVLRRDGKVLISQRQEGHLAGMWEFPGGKLEPGETPEECLARELMEELNVGAEVKDILAVVYHEYQDGPILLLAYDCALLPGEGIEETPHVRWVSPWELDAFKLAPADVAVARKLKEIQG
ncbi:MAG: (deoxy)nucleoside triphosphate pyrophosphohydrolase [Bacillota bacterium]